MQYPIESPRREPAVPAKRPPSAGARTRLLPETLNQGARDMKYDVRGEIYHAAQRRIAEGKEVIFTNVGNPHQMGEKPLTFPRQVLALCSHPELLERPEVSRLFPADAISRAKRYLQSMKGGIGAYSDSRGHACIREEVAGFITRRDSLAPPASDSEIFITNGAGAAVDMILHTIIADSNDCILAPVPQYPLYSACVARFGGTLLGYQLNEELGWSFDLQGLDATVRKARAAGKRPRAIVIINPGNPTGSVLSQAELCDLLAWAGQAGIAVIADEVYQENIYNPGEKPFVSCRQALHALGEPHWSSVELISLHSASKGTFGECGWRGGYFQLMNIAQGTQDILYKVASVQLSPTVPAQVLLGIMCNPPQPGDESHESHEAERARILASLRRRSARLVETFNSLPGVTCTSPDGAMYAFPQIRLPPGALAAAKALGKAPDVFYALRLLEETGICVVPGTGFGQQEGTFHIRTTFLAPEDRISDVQRKFKEFHLEFMDEFQPRSKL